MGKNVHIVPHDDGWAVKTEGNARASSLHGIKKEAVSVGRDAARNERSELFIHGKDGRIQKRDSHGNDPFPPRG